MTLQLFDLPLELLIRVLCFLDLPELSVLQQTHSTFRQLIQDSHGFQYRFAVALAGVASNVHSTHTASERLALLKNREESWLHLNIDFQKSLPNVKFASGIYDLTGGIYFRGDLSRRSIHYFQLPSRSSDLPRWKTINFDKAMVDIGVSVYEHDLIAILTYSPHSTRANQSIIEIVLVELSTGKPHPLARDPILSVGETQESKPSVLLEIVGEFLVLVMTHMFREFPDILQVYEWKTGALKMRIQRPHLTYREFIFLSQTIILLPNYDLNTLDVWQLPVGKKLPPTEPFLCLALPSLSVGSSIFNFSCRCEPNPVPHGTPHLGAPFYLDPEDAIMILNTSLHCLDGVGMYSLFVHRSALLRVCTSYRPEDDGVSHHIPGTFTIDSIPGKRTIAWDNWGPSITRVFDTRWGSLHWITTTAGQRAIVSHVEDSDEEDEEDEDGQDPPRLLDFNPSTVKKVMQGWNEGSSQFNFHDLELDSTAIVITGINHPILSQLPYVEVDIPLQGSRLDRHKGFLLYEDGFLVLLDDDDSDGKIEVLHIGLST